MALVEGEGAVGAFADEAGGHRWQRVPPTERRGRVHTSTVTVAVFAAGEGVPAPTLRDADIEEQRYSGSGAGGQHRNKHANCVRLIHRPTGTTVQVEGKHYHRNRARALRDLAERLQEAHAAQQANAEQASRLRQRGSGMRGDKRRTVALQRGQVTDHVSGWRTSCKKYLRGEW